MTRRAERERVPFVRRLGRAAPLVMAALAVACSGSRDVGAAAGSDGGGGGGGDAAFGQEGGAQAAGWQSAFREDGAGIHCAMTSAQMKAANAPSVTVGAATLYVGFVQMGQNQNPVFARFDGDARTFCEEHEKEPPDGRALGVTWNGGDHAYVVYTIVGGGSAFDTKAKGRFLDRYGDGGGSSKVTFVGEADALGGALRHGTFLIAKKQDGKTNSHAPRSAVIRREDGSLEVLGSSAFQPLNPDHTIMQCTDYPFDTKYVLSADMKSLACSSSTNCVAKSPCP